MMRRIFTFFLSCLAGCTVSETPRIVRQNPQQKITHPETVVLSNSLLESRFAPGSLGRMTQLTFRGQDLLQPFERTSLKGNPLFEPVNCNVYGFRELLWRVKMTLLDLPVKKYTLKKNAICFKIPSYGNTPLDLERTVTLPPGSTFMDFSAKFTNRGKSPYIFNLWLNLLPRQPYSPLIPLEDEIKKEFKLGNNFHPPGANWIGARVASADTVLALQWPPQEMGFGGMFYCHGAQDFNTFEAILGRKVLRPRQSCTIGYRLFLFAGLPGLNGIIEKTGVALVRSGEGCEMLFSAAAPERSREIMIEFETSRSKLTLPALKTGELFKVRLPEIPEALTLEDGREITLTPPEKKKKLRIVAFGDSITEGRTGVKLSDNWLLKLQKKLGRTVRLYNAGVGGNSAREAMDRYASDVLARKPDIILLEFGGNNHTPVPERKYRRVPDEEFKALLEKFKRELPANCKVVVVTFPPIINKKHVYYKLVPGGKVDEELQSQRQIVRDFAKKNGYPLLDLYKLILPRKEEYILRDGVHLSPAGQTFFAEEMAKCLKRAGYVK